MAPHPSLPLSRGPAARFPVARFLAARWSAALVPVFHLALAALLPALLTATLAASPAQAQDPGLEDAWQESYTGMDFVRVPGGCFKMGCEGANCPADQVPAREVCVDPFYAARTEVTQGQWTRVMGQNPSEFKLGDNYPVERVSWNEGQQFLRKLAESSPGPYRFRLPTEAEWEYLCQRCPVPGAAKSKDAARNQARGRTTPRPAGSDEGACQGVRDLSGNVAQWTADVYNKEAYAHLGKANPLNTSGGFDRVYRGACWVGSPDRISCRTRFHATPNTADPCLGLRLVMVPDKARAPDKAPDKAKAKGGAAPAESRPTTVSGSEAPGTEGPAGPNVLRQVLLKSGRDGLSVEFVTRNPVAGRTSQSLLDPPRFVVDLAGQWTSEAALPRDGSVPEVKSVRLGAHPDKLRVVLDFPRSLNLAPRFVPTATGLKVILTEPPGGAGAPGAEPAAEPGAARAEAPRTGTGKTPPAQTGSQAGPQAGARTAAQAQAEAAKSAPDDGPNVLKKISFSRENGRDVAEFSTERPVEEFVYFEAETPPPRLVVNLPGRWHSVAPQQVPTKDGPLSLVNAEVLPDRLRLTLTFRDKPKAKVQFHRTDSGLAVLLPESAQAPPGSDQGRGATPDKPGRTAPLVTPAAKAEPSPPPLPAPDKGGKAKTDAKPGPSKPEAKPEAKPDPKAEAKAVKSEPKAKASPESGRPEPAKPAPPAGEANTVETLRLNSEPGRTVAELMASQPLGDFTYTRLDSPPRLVVTVSGTWSGEPKEAGSELGLVRRMATAVYPDKLMLTLTLSGKPEGRPEVLDLGRGLRITVQGAPAQAGAPEGAEEPGDQSGADVEREPLGRKPKAKAKEAGARVEEPAEAEVKPGSKAEAQAEAKSGAKTEAKAPEQPKAQEAEAASATSAEDKARGLLEEKLKTQLFFSCTMSFASYQTLVWKEGEPKPAELAAKIAPYKQVFKEIALRKGSDEEAWTVLNSPVYDLGIELRRAGKAQSVCERINRLGPEQMDKLSDAAVKARNPEQVKGLVKQALTAPE
jgi:formylglycine-generating enzyme required for sulfatase activity